MRAGLATMAAGLAAGLLNLLLFLPAGWLAGRFLWQDGQAAMAVALVSLAAAAEATAWSPHAHATPAGGREDFRLLNYAQGACLLLGCEAELTWRLAHPAGGWIAGALGGLLIVLGGALRVTAIRRLAVGFGNHSAPVLDDLCVEGIYAFIRHPAETGLGLIAMGFAVATQAWPVMPLVLIPLLAMSLFRVTLEDRALRRAFPAAFASHRRRVLL